MSENINIVVLSGNLTRDPEQRATNGGNPVLAFGIAVHERRKNPNGEWEDYPNYFDCTMFGSRAVGVAPYLRKGMRVVVNGKLRWSQWEKDGKKNAKVEVIVDGLELPPRPQQQDADVYADDIPF